MAPALSSAVLDPGPVPGGRAAAIGPGFEAVSTSPFDRPDRLQRFHFIGGHGGCPFEPGGIPPDLFCLPQGAQVALSPPASFFLDQLAPLRRTDARQLGSGAG